MNKQKITITVPKSEFTKWQQQILSRLSKVVYTENRLAYSLAELKKLTEGSSIIAADPDNFGGFEKAKPRLTAIMESLSNLKGAALSTTSTEWIDLNYCQRRGIVVTNVPYYSTESVAEHALGLMICLAKNIIINDRRERSQQESKFGIGPGIELKGKTLGIIGLGNIGLRIAELGIAIGMRVVAFNRTPKKAKGLKRMSIDNVLARSDFLSVNMASNKNTYHFISKEEIRKIKKGTIVVDLTGPVPAECEVVDKKAMAKALKSNKITSYAYEAEDLRNNPLSNIKTAIGLKGFAWYTVDALTRAKEIWVNNIIGIARGKPLNVVK